jgi:hypothetical protein
MVFAQQLVSLTAIRCAKRLSHQLRRRSNALRPGSWKAFQ